MAADHVSIGSRICCLAGRDRSARWCNRHRIYADAVISHVGKLGNRMAMDDDLPEITVRLEKRVADPQHVLGRLLFERFVWINSGVHEEIVANLRV